VPYSCMLTQLYNDLLGVKLVNPNENLLRTLDTWQIFDTRRSYTCLPQCYYRGIHVGTRLSLLSRWMLTL